MQFAVELDVLEHLASVGLERAAVVVQRYAGSPRDEAVGDSRRQRAAQERVLSILAPAAHNIIPLVELLEQPWNIGWVVLEIGIDSDHHVAARAREPRRERRRLTEIATEPHHSQPRVARRQLAENRVAPI